MPRSVSADTFSNASSDQSMTTRAVERREVGRRGVVSMLRSVRSYTSQCKGNTLKTVARDSLTV